MRSTRQNLEQAVINAARSCASTGSIWCISVAIKNLDEHLGDLTNATGSYGPNSPETSVTAASLARMTLHSARRQIINEIRCIHGMDDRGHLLMGYTDDELESALKRPHTTISSARNSLVNAGWLKDSGFVRETRAGRYACVWTLTEAAVAALES